MNVLKDFLSQKTKDAVYTGVKQMVTSPAESDSQWFMGSVADTFEEHAPAYITVISFICALGCLHNFLTSHGKQNQHYLTRLYSSIAQCVVTILSFMTIVDKPHLQQIACSALLIAFNFFQATPSLLDHLPHVDMDTIKQGVANIQENVQGFMQKQVDAWEHRGEDHKEQKDKQHHQQQQNQQPGTLYQRGGDDDKQQNQQQDKQQQDKQQQDKQQDKQQNQPRQQQQQQQQRHGDQQQDKQQANDLSSTSRLVLTWVKTAILTYCAALPALLTNNTHVSRTKFSLLNPFSWFFGGREYALLNPFSLSLINVIGISIAAIAIMLHSQPDFFKQSIFGKTIMKFLPAYYNSMANYFIFTCGLFLTGFSMTRPLTWLALITPALSFFFMAIRWGLNMGKKSANVPSLIRKLDQQTWAKNALVYGEKLLPCVAV